MRSIVSVGLLLLLASSLEAQGTPVRATRFDGGVVLLYPDGTWKPDTDRRSKQTTGGYQKPEAASASLSILKGAVLAYDPAKWTPAKQAKAGRHQLNHRDGDGYALIIAERLEIPMESLKNIVLDNARTAAPDAKIVRQEQRRVNGADITCMEIAGTTQGIKFRYFGYYYAGKAGTIQVITYTGENLFSEYRDDFEELLNGFTVTAS